MEGLLVGADHIGVRLQLLALEDPVVQVQDHSGLGGKVGVAGEDPGAVLPRLDRVLGQPAPQRGGGDVVDQAGGQDLGAQFSEAPAAKRDAAGGGQLTGDRLARGDHRGREGARAAGPLAVAQTFHALLVEAFAPLAGRVGRQPELAGDPPVGPPRRGQQHDAGPGHLAMLGRAPAHQRLQHPPLRRPQRDLERAAPAATCHHPSRPQAGPGGRPGREATGTRPGAISEDGPVASKAIPESTKTSLGQRLRAHQRARWPALAGVHTRFRGRFAYVDGELQDGEVLPLCRLRYAGSASLWGTTDRSRPTAPPAPPASSPSCCNGRRRISGLLGDVR